jgi:hypothetical protein
MNRHWVLRILVTAALYGIVVGAMAITGMEPHAPLLAAVTAAGAAAYWLIADLADAVGPARWVVQPTEVRHRGGDTRVDHLRWRLSARPDDEVDASTFAPLLIALLDDRVAAVYGVERVSDPESYERIVGPQLAAFVSAPPSDNRARNPQYLAGILSRIESL